MEKKGGEDKWFNKMVSGKYGGLVCMSVCIPTLEVRSLWKMPLLWRYCRPLAMSRDRAILTPHDRYMSLSRSCSRLPPLMY